MAARVLFIGPFPPPTDGRALATAWLAAALGSRGFEITWVDTQTDPVWPPPRFAMGALRRLLRCLRGALRILWSRPDSVVVVASGGLGLLGEMAPLLAARLTRAAVLMTHHSSSYVIKRSAVLAAAVAVGGDRLTHVVLSEQMRTMMNERYGLDPALCLALSNAALMPPPLQPAVTRHRRALHMANMRASKGSLVAIEVASRLGSLPNDPLVHVAGPRDAEVRAALDAATNSGVGISDLGPLSSDEKLVALARARVFLFPTTYPHEAQPLVIYESASLGVVPIVWSAGWVREQMAQLGLEQFVFAPGDVDAVVTATRRLLEMPTDEFNEIAASVYAKYHHVREQGQTELDAVAARLAGDA